MDKDEAIKLAYEVLEYIYFGALNQGAHTGISWRDVAIRAKPVLTAIEEALAQSKHTPTLGVMVANHDQQIKDLAAHLLELKQLVTPMMEFKKPTKICGPNLEDTLNAVGFYRKKEWVGLTGDEIEDLPKDKTWWEIIRAAEAKLREKNT